ncbi:glycosyltransferase family 2 protein [Pararobbsia silviterrae]|uniref:Glycosyltransferase family 2 protein n=2 Tax=Pararobbsia silviterrae TaxID=1792498 RepID=A0A494XZI0_9BURK|nr:glycosyltransferase family 2 protein [Pararobbsia silviterrae]
MVNAFEVSICIPTCNRPDLLDLAIRSCLAQTYPHIHVLIGDDSTDDRTQRWMQTHYALERRVHYLRNERSLGQGANVSRLFERAHGDKIVLLHDDDLLEPDGVRTLLELWDRVPDLEVAFGDQYLIDMQGRIDYAASARCNSDFLRTASAEGLQAVPGRTGLVSMFPNNGWLANADIVKQVGYQSQYGAGCDYVFGVELCLKAKKIYYVKRYVSSYRRTPGASSVVNRGSLRSSALEALRLVSSLDLSHHLEPARRIAYKRMVPVAVSTLSRNNEPVTGLRLAMRHLHAYHYGLSRRFYYHMMLIGTSWFRRRRKTPRF